MLVPTVLLVAAMLVPLLVIRAGELLLLALAVRPGPGFGLRGGGGGWGLGLGWRGGRGGGGGGGVGARAGSVDRGERDRLAVHEADGVLEGGAGGQVDDHRLNRAV